MGAPPCVAGRDDHSSGSGHPTPVGGAVLSGRRSVLKAARERPIRQGRVAAPIRARPGHGASSGVVMLHNSMGEDTGTGSDARCLLADGRA